MRIEQKIVIGGILVISIPIAGAFLYDIGTGKKHMNTVVGRLEKITTGRQGIRDQQKEEYQKWREEKKLENRRKRELQEIGNPQAI